MKNICSDIIYFLSPLNISGIRIIIGQNVKNNFPRHIHDSFCIGIIDSGTRVIEIEGNKQLINQNEVFVINPGQPHRCKSLQEHGHNYRVISINSNVMKNFISQIEKEIRDIPNFKKTLIIDPVIKDGINTFFNSLLSEDTILEKRAKLSLLLSDLIFKYAEKQTDIDYFERQRSAVKKACDYIRSNYAEKISLSNLSEEVCLSPFHFQKVFLKEKGISPWEYANKIRIDSAVSMLCQGDSIAEVSFATGFTDQSHFTKCFKRATGLTPGRYIQSSDIIG